MKCECGCGQDTNPAPQTRARDGIRQGQPQRYIRGHGNRKHPHGWDVVDCGYETECWIWRGEQLRGYARLGGRQMHREMWVTRNGPIPSGMQLDHLCRQTLCVRPEHCEPATNAENTRRSNSAKINYEVADLIRAEHGSLRAIGKKYGLCHTTVLAIRRGQAWT